MSIAHAGSTVWYFEKDQKYSNVYLDSCMYVFSIFVYVCMSVRVYVRLVQAAAACEYVKL